MTTLGDVIGAAAAKYGQDPGYLSRVAQIESTNNPNADNGIAKGLFQFVPRTAKQYGLANPFDPAASSDAAARLTRDDAAYLTKQLGRQPTGPELYLAHQQGMGGAAGLLLHPDTPAASIVGQKAITQNGGAAGMTAGQFAQLWANKFAGAQPHASRVPILAQAGNAPAGFTPNAPALNQEVAAIAAMRDLPPAAPIVPAAAFAPSGPSLPDLFGSAQNGAQQAADKQRRAALFATIKPLQTQTLA